MKKWILVMLSVTFIFSTSALAQVTIYSTDIPGLHQKDGQGDYDKIINKSVVKSGLAKLVVLPPARTVAKFKQCSNCCYSPANKNPEFYDFGANYVETKPMGVAKIYIFTRSGEKVISSLSQLKGKRVGARRGMPYGKTFDNSGLKVELVNTIAQNIKKLKVGRIYAFIAYIPDAYTVFEKMGMKPLPHAKDKPVAVHEDNLVCKGVSPSFIKKFNKALK